MTAQESEATATVYQPEPCLHCGGPVVAPRRKGLIKSFCSDRHRAAHRDQRIAKAVQDAKDAVQESMDELQRLQARLAGALLLVDQALPKRARGK